MPQNIIAGLFMLIIGLLLALKPRQVWKVTESWKTLGQAQVSPVAVMVLRVVGIVLAVTAAAVMLFGH